MKLFYWRTELMVHLVIKNNILKLFNAEVE
jgi:hypothetical protein